MRLHKYLFLLFLFPFSLFASECDVRGVEADAPVLCGHAVQGGFLFGTTDWRLKSSLPSTIGKDGVFVIGLPMDAPDNLNLRFCKGIRCRSFNYRIAQRQYKEQHVTVPRRFIEYPPEVQKRIDSERAKIRAARGVSDLSFLEFMDWRYPFDRKHPMTSVYGSRRVFNGIPMSPHNGIDIAAPRGTPVRPIGQGSVVLALDSFLNGKTVIVAHGYGMFSVYIHLDRIDVRAGDVADFSTVLGTVGATGRVSGPHLHLGLYHYNTALDPALVLGL